MGLNVSIYGLSSEGYNLASILALNGINVVIIDDMKRMAFNLSKEIANAYPDVNTLKIEEPLLHLISESEAIKNAEYIFFAPKIRNIGQEALDEINTKFKDVITNIQQGSSIIFNIPLGFGMNQKNIELIEHITGFKVNNDINYHYMPLGPEGYPKLIGSIREDDTLLNILNSYDEQLQFADIESIEALYINRILSHYIPLINTFEIFKYTKKIIDREELRSIYLDDIAEGLFDLKMISLSLVSNAPLASIVNNSIKSIEGYLKYIVDKLKRFIKENNIKTNLLRAFISWTFDQNEIRSSKSYLLQLLENKLRDNITYVNKNMNIMNDKISLIIICSRNDYNMINSNQRYDPLRYDYIIINANPFCETIKKIIS